MSTGGGDFEGPLRHFLATNIGKVRGAIDRFGLGRAGGRGQGDPPREMSNHVEQRLAALQLALIALGFAVSTSYLGPALAAAGNVTPEANHATAYALISLAYMLLGAAPGPVVTGYLADASELSLALGVIPVLAVAGGVFFLAAAKSYTRDVERLAQSTV